MSENRQPCELELSTRLLMDEAGSRGAAVEILDRADNMIRIRKNGMTEIIRQATMTSADSYITALIMENKTVTKQLLAEAGMRVPAGYEVRGIGQLPENAGDPSMNGGIVIKPKSTNFGIGVTVLDRGFTIDEMRAAAAEALRHDRVALVEEKIEGTELRFLVIGGMVRAVLERIPAHVTGDGRSTVRRLVREKNKDPRRGTGYAFPMEKIRLGAIEKALLKTGGLDADSIPSAGLRVFLRKNSNISTGGEGIDRTDEVHPGYFDLAIRAAAVVGAAICGIDIIIGDYRLAPGREEKASAGRYGIIELNFNPALHIHDYPAVGINRRVEQYVLDLLGID